MTPQERDVINGIFERLKQAATQQRDPEAERHIATLVAQQPYATYALAQSVYVQEQALTNLQAQVEQMQAQIGQLQQAAQQQAAQPQPTGGFLSGLFGGGAARPQPQAAPPGGPWGGAPQGGRGMQQAPQAGAWGQQPQQQGGPWGGQPAAPQAGGSSFLGTALTTAAGVAGGMVVGNMLMNAFKGDSGQGGGKSAAQDASGQGASGIEPMNQAAAPQHLTADDFSDEPDPTQNAGYDGYDGGGDSYDA